MRRSAPIRTEGPRGRACAPRTGPGAVPRPELGDRQRALPAGPVLLDGRRLTGQAHQEVHIRRLHLVQGPARRHAHRPPGVRGRQRRLGRPALPGHLSAGAPRQAVRDHGRRQALDPGQRPLQRAGRREGVRARPGDREDHLRGRRARRGPSRGQRGAGELQVRASRRLRRLLQRDEGGRPDDPGRQLLLERALPLDDGHQAPVRLRGQAPLQPPAAAGPLTA